MHTEPNPQPMSEAHVEVAVRLGEGVFALREMLSVSPGSTLCLPQRADEPVVLEVDGVAAASGRVVAAGGRFGFLLDRVLDGARVAGGAPSSKDAGARPSNSG
jgi:flagellar motor switch/type III secretory pathway protein FliN